MYIKGDKTLITNYRPISLLFSQKFLKMLYIKDYLTLNNILVKNSLASGVTILLTQLYIH